MQIQVTRGYTVEYMEQFYASDEADEILRAFLAVEMTPEIILMYGRDIVTKRRSEQYGIYGIDYTYNPTAKKSKEWTPLMLSIRQRMESVAGRLDGGLVQMYRMVRPASGGMRTKGIRKSLRH